MYINMIELTHLIKKRQDNNKYIGMPFGSAIRYKREQMNMTLEEASADICSLSYLSKLENNIIKPSAHFVDMFKERFNIEDEYVYDSDGFKIILEKIIRALLLDQTISSFELQAFDQREDYESVLVNFAYYVLNDDTTQIEFFYKKMVKTIISMPEEAFMTAMLLVNQLLYKEMRYTDGVSLLNRIEQFEPRHEKIKLLIIKGITKHAFKMNNYMLIYKSFDDYKDKLIQKQLFSQLKKLNVEKLEHESRYRLCQDIVNEISQIDAFDETDKNYLNAKCYFHKGEYDKTHDIASNYKDHTIDWMMLYLLSLEHLKETKKILHMLDHYPMKKHPRLDIIIKHLYHKYKATHEEQMNYIKRDILTFHGMTEDHEILNFLLKDCEQMLTKQQYYKDAVSLYRIFVKKIHNLSFA